MFGPDSKPHPKDVQRVADTLVGTRSKEKAEASYIGDLPTTLVGMACFHTSRDAPPPPREYLLRNGPGAGPGVDETVLEFSFEVVADPSFNIQHPISRGWPFWVGGKAWVGQALCDTAWVGQALLGKVWVGKALAQPALAQPALGGLWGKSGIVVPQGGKTSK